MMSWATARIPDFACLLEYLNWQTFPQLLRLCLQLAAKTASQNGKPKQARREHQLVCRISQVIHTYWPSA